MSEGIQTKKYIGQAKCPDCGVSYMNVYDNGTYHCGSCLMGGMLICTDPTKGGKHTHIHLVEMFKKKIINEKVRDFQCDESHGQNGCPKFKTL